VCSSDVLRCDATSIPAEHMYATEIALYSPVLTIFPEIQGNGPPWKHGADYHPRAIELYLDNAKPRSTTWWRAPGWAFLVTKPVNGIIDAVTRLFRTANPKSLRDMLSEEPDRGLPQMTLDSGVRPGQLAWKRYFEILDADPDKYPHRCYVRVVRKGADRIAIEYWFFYYFNDFWNTHQTDFEVVTVLLRREDEAGAPLSPSGCFYGSHRGGVLRPWRGGVWKTGRTHPIAFVGRGSHAMYAEPFIGKPHIPELPWFNWRISFLNLTGAIRQTFWGKPVPEEIVALNQKQIKVRRGGTYDVRIVPSSVECVRPAAFQPRWVDPWAVLEDCKAEVDWTDF